MIEMMLKRLFDIAIVLIFSPILLTFAILISFVLLLKQGSPIFFVQNRVGKNNKLFKLYKFRTMEITAEELLTPHLRIIHPSSVRVGGHAVGALRTSYSPKISNGQVSDEFQKFCCKQRDLMTHLEEYNNSLDILKHRH